MAEDRKIGLSIDFKDTKKQILDIVKALNGMQQSVNDVGKEGSESFKSMDSAVNETFNNLSFAVKNVKRFIQEGGRVSKAELRDIVEKSRQASDNITRSQTKNAELAKNAEKSKRKEINETIKAQKKAASDLEKLADSSAKSIKQQEAAYKNLQAVIAFKVGQSLKALIKDSTVLAARNEVLATAMRTVANNMGITNAEIDRSEATIRKLGISINDTRELISRFAQAQLGMENATKLARAAQDLAAGSTLGSSEALRIMTQSILSLLPRQLRQFGVVVNLNQVYKEQSLLLGKTVDDLTDLEKRQGLLNVIFREADKRAGAYTRSMEDVGKVMTSLSSRIIPDTLSQLGEGFLPLFRILVFNFQSLLESLQQLSGGWKTFIAAIVAGLASIALLKAALLGIFTITGLLVKGTLGGAAAAATYAAALNPLIIAVGALAAAFVIIPALMEDTITAQQKLAESSTMLFNEDFNRLKVLKDLSDTLKDQSLTQEELTKIIALNVGKVKELVPFLNKEKVSREEVLAVLEKSIEVQERVSKKSLAIAKVRVADNLKRLRNEKFVINELIKLEDRLVKAREDAFILKGSAVKKEIEDFTSRLTKQQQALERLGKFTSLALTSDFDTLRKESVKLNEEISKVSQDLSTNFGTMAKNIGADEAEMKKTFMSLSQELDKLEKKDAKRFPFKNLIEQQEKFIERTKKAVISNEQRNEIIERSNKMFQTRLEREEFKFVEKLESIGQGRLAKIEARRAKEVEINQGSVRAIKAIELEAAQERNEIFSKMWDDRITSVTNSTNALIEIVRKARDFAIRSAEQEANVELTKQTLSSRQRIEIRRDFYDRALRIQSISQEEEFSLRSSLNDRISQKNLEYFEKGIIDEQMFNDKSKQLAIDLSNFRQKQIEERTSTLTNALNFLYSEETRLRDNLKSIEMDRLNSVKSIEAAIRQLRQEGQTDFQNRLEERERAEQLLLEGESALRENNFKRAKDLAEEVKNIALANSKEVRVSGEKDAEVLISADKARTASLKQIEAAGALLERAFSEQRRNEVSALKEVESGIVEIELRLKSLTSEAKEIEVKIIGNALKEIESINSQLANLKDKTITVTIKTVNVGGGAVATSPVGGETGAGAAPTTPATSAATPTAAFANGVVDLKGKGTSLSDSILAMLSNGESVVTAKATEMFKPLLELMNMDPSKLYNILSPRLKSPDTNSRVVSSETFSIGDVVLNINGVKDVNDFKSLNMRELVRTQIWPEIIKMKKRKAYI